ncbi:MAG: hypothetical protein HYX52_05755 [Chloroflexi bacterium]|nr:hypothetical protein [Chloroflexota bacterium]
MMHATPRKPAPKAKAARRAVPKAPVAAASKRLPLPAAGGPAALQQLLGGALPPRGR